MNVFICISHLTNLGNQSAIYKIRVRIYKYPSMPLLKHCINVLYQFCKEKVEKRDERERTVKKRERERERKKKKNG